MKSLPFHCQPPGNINPHGRGRPSWSQPQPPSQVIISAWFRKLSRAQCNSPGSQVGSVGLAVLDRGETRSSERLSDFSKSAQQAQCPSWGPSLGAWEPHVVSMVPTLLWGKEITSTSDVDSESTRQRVGRGWSPRDPQHLAWGWAHSVKHSVKIYRGNGSRLLPCPGGRPREPTLLVYYRNSGPILLPKEGGRLAVSWSRRVRATGPVSWTHVSWTTASHSGPHLLSPLGVCASGL